MTVQDLKSNLVADIDKTCEFIKELSEDIKADSLASMEGMLNEVKTGEASLEKAMDGMAVTVDVMARTDLVTYLHNAVQAVLEKYTNYKEEE